jgi:hypothetical protein
MEANMITTEPITTAGVPFTPAMDRDDRLGMPTFTPRTPVFIEPDDGLTQEERWDRYEAAAELLANSTYDFDCVARNREMERRQAVLKKLERESWRESE